MDNQQPTYQQAQQLPQTQRPQSQLQQQQQPMQQQQLMQQQQFQQQDRPCEPNASANNDNKRKSTKISRKRSLSSSSTSSSGSPFNNIFSTASSSDSGLSSMTSSKSCGASAAKRKRPLATALQHPPSSTSASDKASSNGYVNTNTTINTDSSSGGDTSSSSQNHSSIPSLKSFSNAPGILPPRVTAQRSVPAFLNKLYNMVEDTTTNDLIRWSKDGTSFIVEKHEEFAKTVLPRFYKHNTFASFVRQLNMYDFHKVPHLQQGVLIAETEHEIWEFSNPHFQRGRPDLLVLVTRKRNRDKDANDNENVSISTLVQDLQALKKQQSVIGAELRDLHRDNEILWQETLTAREKYQRHQEAIEKILQFLTVIFSNNNNDNSLAHQNLAITMNTEDPMPKGLIEEAASLAGMSTLTNTSTSNSNPRAHDDKGKSASSNTLPSASLTSAALSNILSSVLRLYSTYSPPDVDIPNSMLNQHSTRPNLPKERNQHLLNTEYDPSTQTTTSISPTEPAISEQTDKHASNSNHRNIVDFSKTLSSATRSAQSITQDIDMLQVNIESLANNLGIDPSQLDDDLDASTAGLHLRSDYNTSTVPINTSKLDGSNDNSYPAYHSTTPNDLRHANMTAFRSQMQARPQPENILATSITNSNIIAPGPTSSMNQYGFRLQQPPQGRFSMSKNQQQLPQQFRSSNLQPQTRPQTYGIPSPTAAQLSFQTQQQQQHISSNRSGYAPMAQQDFMAAPSEEPVLGPPPPSQSTDGFGHYFNTSNVSPMNYSLPNSYGSYNSYPNRNEALYGQEMDSTAASSAVSSTGPATSSAPGGPSATATANQRFQSTTAYYPPHPHQMAMTDDNNNNHFYAEGPVSFHNTANNTNTTDVGNSNNSNDRSRTRKKNTGKR